MYRKQITTTAAALAAIVLATGAQGGCGGSSGKSSSGGGGGAAPGCSFDTFLNAPVHRQLTATSSVSCALQIEEATTTLVIQGKKTGSGAAAWDNFDDPKRLTTVPPNALSYTVACVGGYDYQASADITGTWTDGKPFHYHETTPVASYTTADCTQN